MRGQTANLPSPDLHSQGLTQAICNALEGLRPGAVEIIIHDAKVAQIERKEKIRFENENALPAKTRR